MTVTSERWPGSQTRGNAVACIAANINIILILRDPPQMLYAAQIDLIHRLRYCTIYLYNIHTVNMGNASYSSLRENLAEIWDTIEDSREPVIVERRGHQALAILPADELASLEATAHLLRSPRNAARLLTALQRALKGTSKPIGLDELRKNLDLDTVG